MRPQSIARLDRYIGKPVCAVLTLFDHFRRLFPGRTVEPPRRILFVKLIEMGSTVLACPAFAEATRRVGRENIFMLVFAPNRAIVDVLPYFPSENVLTIDDSNLLSFARGLCRALWRVRKEKIDAAIDMEGLTCSSAIITYLTGARTRVGYYNFSSQGPYRGRLFNRELNYTFQHHTSEAFLGLVRALWASAEQVPLLKERLPPASERPRFEPTDQERQAVLARLRERAGREQIGRLVLLNPNCSDLLPLRRWPDENFVALGKRLLSEYPDITLAITGAPKEKEEAEKIAGVIGPRDRVVSMAGHTNLRELLALYGESQLLISNDSGPCHFATLTPVHVIALFGPETPLLYAPLGDRATVITANLSCSPCVNMLNHRFSPCTDNQCMKQIPVDAVYEAAERILRAG